MKTLSLAEVEYLSFRLAKELLEFDEPIPEFSTRFPNVLESCLAVPFQKFAKQDAYPGLIKKAAILFYLMIKNHPFQNLPAPQAGSYCIYALKCSDNSIYIGQTENLGKRLIEHRKGFNQWTKGRLPVGLVYFEPYNTRQGALEREKKLKTGFGRKWLKRQIEKGATRQAGGNKRIAMTTLFIFLYKNKKWLKVDDKGMYNFAVWVAQSPADVKREVVLGIEKFLKKYLVTLP